MKFSVQTQNTNKHETIRKRGIRKIMKTSRDSNIVFPLLVCERLVTLVVNSPKISMNQILLKILSIFFYFSFFLVCYGDILKSELLRRLFPNKNNLIRGIC